MKKIFAFIFLAITILTGRICADNNTNLKEVIIQLCVALKKEAEKNPEDGPKDFKAILDPYFDWNLIFDRVFSTARLYFRDKQNDNPYQVFKKNNLEKFKKYIIDKYSKSDYLDKFKHIDFDFKNINPKKHNEKVTSVYVTAHDIKDVNTKWKVTWKIWNETLKIFETEIEGVRIFEKEKDEFKNKITNGLAQNKNNMESVFKEIEKIFA